jgi:hypothetical protein
MRIAALTLGLVAGLVAAGSAVSALTAVGRDPLYQPRLGFGLTALLLAGVTLLGAWDAQTHPVRGAVSMLVAGGLGTLAINLYYIDTLYVLAVPLWMVGALLALLSPRRRADDKRP